MYYFQIKETSNSNLFESKVQNRNAKGSKKNVKVLWKH